MIDKFHPLVVEYLRRFDAEAVAIPPGRRASLREQVESHLRDAIAVDSADSDAAAAIAEFGSPAEIIAQELDDATPSAGNRRRPRTRSLVIACLVAVVALAIPVGITLIGQYHAESNPGPPSIVNEAAEGPTRVTQGQAYFEFLAAIEAMEYPLPPGASYPDGVPEGFDVGPGTGMPGGVLESGMGNHVAHFTWMCAWETEYLAAFDEKDYMRLVKAESMLTAWTDTEWHRELDSGGGWATNVLGPLKVGDPSGVTRDLAGTCARAGIFNVRP